MDQSFHIRPYAFDRVFEVGGGEARAESHEELRVRIAVLEAELALARDDRDAIAAGARAMGYDEAIAERRAESETALLAAVDALHAAVESVDAQLEDIAGDSTRIAAEVALSAAQFLAARAFEASPGAAIDAAIGRVLGQVARGQEIQVTVAPNMVEDVERLIAARQAGERRRLALSVVGDPALSGGDAHIHWDRGGVVLDAAQRLAAVHEALGGLTLD
ncbi:MAG TPA: FliH/SctL family protein [Sphingomonas sp.]|jgi:flagellar assembly protein FliH|uniref:FliH/SctL family protein n=1 Tax=Sphingomonas sp. TaxID=28214 RepID=UPI002ED87597